MGQGRQDSQSFVLCINDSLTVMFSIIYFKTHKNREYMCEYMCIEVCVSFMYPLGMSD